MSKYIDLMLALNKLWKLCVEDIDAEISESETFDFGRARDALADLPTIEVSEDAISREWVLDKLEDYRRDYPINELDDWQNTVVNWIAMDVEDAPSVLPKPKEGEWIRTGRTNIYGGIEVQCSNCGDKAMVQHLEDEWYCRHCGADMGMKGAE